MQQKQDWIDLCEGDDYEEEDQTEVIQQNPQQQPQYTQNKNYAPNQRQQRQKQVVQQNEPKEDILAIINKFDEGQPVFLNLWNLDKKIDPAYITQFYKNIQILDIYVKNLEHGIVDLKIKNKREAQKLLNQGNGKIGRRVFYIRNSHRNIYNLEKHEEAKKAQKFQIIERQPIARNEMNYYKNQEKEPQYPKKQINPFGQAKPRDQQHNQYREEQKRQAYENQIQKQEEYKQQQKQQQISQKPRVNPFGQAKPREENLKNKFIEQKVFVVKNQQKEQEEKVKTPEKVVLNEQKSAQKQKISENNQRSGYKEDTTEQQQQQQSNYNDVRQYYPGNQISKNTNKNYYAYKNQNQQNDDQQYKNANALSNESPKYQSKYGSDNKITIIKFVEKNSQEGTAKEQESKKINKTEEIKDDEKEIQSPISPNKDQRDKKQYRQQNNYRQNWNKNKQDKSEQYIISYQKKSQEQLDTLKNQNNN